MNRSSRRILFFTLLIALLAIPTMAVAAKELGLLTISGPGIKGEITLNNPDDMAKLQGSGFFDQPSGIKAPAKLGDGYNITAYLNLDSKMVPVVQMVYYPGEEGQTGYWHITGRFKGEELQALDQWGQLRPQAENAFRNLMTAHRIKLQPAIASAPAEAAPPAEVQAAAQPATIPVVSPVQNQTPLLAAALLAAILVLLGGGLALKRRFVAQHSV